MIHSHNALSIWCVRVCALRLHIFMYLSIIYRTRQITAWDYSRYGNNDFLGMTLLDVAGHPLDDETEWYALRTHHDAHQGLNVSVCRTRACCVQRFNMYYYY